MSRLIPCDGGNIAGRWQREKRQEGQRQQSNLKKTESWNMGQAEMRETPKLKTGDDDANKNAQKSNWGMTRRREMSFLFV
jgi:hypothetical protein